MEIRLALSDSDLLRCFPVMRELRPALQEQDFVARIRLQQSEGYALALLEERGNVTTVSGFRVQQMLSSGKTMYVDDLVTAETARSRGHGRAMLAWLIERARTEACATFSLDSGTQRKDAHAFYLRERLRIAAFHFDRSL